MHGLRVRDEEEQAHTRTASCMMIKPVFVSDVCMLHPCVDAPFRYPQITAINILTSYIKHGDVKNADMSSESGGTSDAGITSEITGNVDWRQAGKFKYRKNE